MNPTEVRQTDNISKIVGLYIESAKMYTQLSSGALVLSITFLHEVLGIDKGKVMPLDWSLVTSWICFLIAILSSSLYQYLGIKYLEVQYALPSIQMFGIRSLVKNPWLVYGLMVVSFYLGAVLFTLSAILRFM